MTTQEAHTPGTSEAKPHFIDTGDGKYRIIIDTFFGDSADAITIREMKTARGEESGRLVNSYTPECIVEALKTLGLFEITEFAKEINNVFYQFTATLDTRVPNHYFVRVLRLEGENRILAGEYEIDHDFETEERSLFYEKIERGWVHGC